MEPLIKVGGAWVSVSKTGRKYLSVKIESAVPTGARVLLFKNETKDSESQPDYRAMMQLPETKPQIKALDGGDLEF